MKEIQVVLRGPPMSTNSVYKHARGISYMTKKGRELKKSYVEQATQQCPTWCPTEEVLDIVIRLFFHDKRVRDWDNYHKLSMDALNKLVWLDDSQIQKATVYKGYDKVNPRIEITINKYK